MYQLVPYILKEPDAATARGDVALLNVTACHFRQVDDATEGMCSFDFPRDCNALCLRPIRASKGSRRGKHSTYNTAKPP